MSNLQLDKNNLSNPANNPRAFYNLVRPKLLTWHFLESYTKLTPNWGPLGLVVYLRTYSRYVPELKRREFWWETVLRVVEYSMSLYKGSTTTNNIAALIKEAQILYDNIFNLKVFPAGRSLWCAGSHIAQQDATSQFNCAFLVVNKLESFEHLFHLLLVGAGCGFSVEQKYVSQLPAFKTDVIVTHKPYNQKPKSQRLEATKVQCQVTFPNRRCKTIIEVGDSRAGWEKALYEFLYALQEKQNTVEIEVIYDSIRPAGERLKTMGGRASGPNGLIKMFQRITKVINETKEGKLSPVQAMDINNFVAEAVVVGGTRRSSQISLGDLENTEFIQAKHNLWSDPEKEAYKSTRVMSNNSVAFYRQPTREKLAELIESTKTHGDPGLINAEAALKRRSDFQGVNPCGEILLRDKGVCNLCEVNVLSFVLGLDNFDYQGFTKAVQLATRMASRITNTTLWHPDWDAVQKRDRLLGVSLTGQVEAWDALGWGHNINEVGAYTYTNDYRIIEVLELYKQTARTEADIYHEEMGIPRSLLVTTTKPSGTISNLCGVSAGIHRPYAPYYLRRVRVSKNDPVAKALRSIGIPCSPENSQGLELDADECNTWVFTFPIKTNAPIQAVDERAVDQLERYKQSMVYAIEHNSSITISVAPEEWSEVLDWLDIQDNWNSFVGVSFLPKFDSTNSPYPQMPYTTISRLEYETVVANTPNINEAEFLRLIAEYEQEQEEYELDQDCATGSCPIR